MPLGNSLTSKLQRAAWNHYRFISSDRESFKAMKILTTPNQVKVT